MSCQSLSCRMLLFIVVFGLGLSRAVAYEATPAKPASPDQTAQAAATITPTLPQDLLDALHWRCIGPANMGGRITAIAVYEKDPCIWWVATASGGLLKTTNNGVTFEHQFDHESTVSIGDVAVAQTDPNIVWVGTGEANPRNSVSWGDGVYKSVDGGKTFTNMGLKKSFQIGRVAIHPTDPNTVYVGALGRLWGPNEERGLFKTTDGGETWIKVLYIDDKTGVVDVRMNPDDPETLLVAAYERERGRFDSNDPAKKMGPGSAVYKTANGGKTWMKITAGLPSGAIGRIGIDYYRKDPSTVYLVLESELAGKQPENSAFMGIRGEDVEVGAKLTEITKEGPAEKAEFKVDDIVLAVDDSTVHSYADLTREIRKRMAGDKAEIEVSRKRKTVMLEVTFDKRPEPEGDGDGSRRRRGPFSSGLGGQRENVQDQQGPEGHEYGGLYKSTDGGDTWKRINSVNPRPMYYSQIRIDPRDDKNIYVLGTSLYRSKDGGETFTADGGRGVHVDHHTMWIDPKDGRHMILGNDGGVYVTYDRMENWDHLNHMAIGQFYHVTVDSRRNYRVYGGLQDNGSWGGPSRSRHGNGPVNHDWFSIGGGDGFVCLTDPEDPDQVYSEMQNGGMRTMNLRTGERASIRPRGSRGQRYRFNWKTPFILSSHNPRIHYSAGNFVFRSLDRGQNIKTISPEITRTQKGAATALAESSRDSDVLYVGTNDGAMWVTKNGGHEWSKAIDFPDDEPEEDAKGEDKDKDQDKDKDESKKEAEVATKSEREPAAKEESKPGPRPNRDATVRERAEPPGQGPPSAGERPRSREALGQRGGADGRAQFIERIKERDTNGDGKIQREEASVRMARFFDRIDTNGDGVLDQDELKAMGQSRRRSPQQQRDSQEEPPQRRETPSEETKPTPTAPEESRVGTAHQPPKQTPQPRTPQVGRAVPHASRLRREKHNLPPKPGKELDSKGSEENPPTAKTPDESPTPPARPAGPASWLARSAPKAPADEAGAQPHATALHPSAEQLPATKRTKKKSQEPAPERASGLGPRGVPEGATSAPPDDPLSGEWTAQMLMEGMPEGRGEFVMHLELGDEDKVSGSYRSQMSEGDATGGTFDRTTGKLSIVFDSGQFSLDLRASVSGSNMNGDVDVGGGMFGFDFTARRTKPAAVTTLAEASEQTPATKEEVEAKPLTELLPAPRWVSSIEASRAETGRVYVTLDGHRSNDDEPYVFVSEDTGQTWRSIRANLPTSAGSTRVIREDIVNPDILYLGTEFGAWVSVDRGQSWTKFNSNLPTVAVHEFAIHPTAGEIVAATHGRSLWVLDVTPLRQMTDDTIGSDAHLYKPNTAIYWRTEPRRGGSGARRYVGENPSSGAAIHYSLKAEAAEVVLTVTDLEGKTIRQLEGKTEAGLNRIAWDLRRKPDPRSARRSGQGGRSGSGNFRGGRSRRGKLVPSGTYKVVLAVDGQEFTQDLIVQTDPEHPDYQPWADEEAELEYESSKETDQSEETNPEALLSHKPDDI